MPPFDIRDVETYCEVPIFEVTFSAPTLLTAEKDLELIQALIDLPHPLIGVILNYRNLSHATDYGPEEQVNTYRTPLFQDLKRRLVAVVRYHAASFTSMIQTMRANMLIRSSLYSNFAPDFEAALRFVRRAIDQATERVP
jgi:hypothetical protein